MTAVAPGGPGHVGYLYDEPDDLVPGVLPRVRATLADGGRVSAILDRRHARELREAVGPEADIAFTSGATFRESGRDGFVAHLRDVAGSAPGLVVVAYAAVDVPDAELRAGEEELDAVLAGLPVTLICACASDDRATRLATLRATHRSWLGRDGVEARPDAAVESVALPRPGDAHVLGLTFRSSADLRVIRAQIARVAQAAGMSEDETTRAVVAVHEAAVVVGRVAWAEEVPCELDVWTSDGSIAAAVRGPRPGAAGGPDEVGGAGPGGVDPVGADGGIGSVADRLPRHPTRRPGPLDHVRLFCRHACIDDADDGSRVISLVAGGV